jgi:hypothetical protein
MFDEEFDSWYSDVYSSPKKHGLEIFGEANQEDMCYAYNKFVIWKTKEGKYFYGDDSGCSCPSPFEEYRSIDNLYPVYNKEQLLTAIDNWVNGSLYSKGDRIRPAHNLRSKVMRLRKF